MKLKKLSKHAGQRHSLAPSWVQNKKGLSQVPRAVLYRFTGRLLALPRCV